MSRVLVTGASGYVGSRLVAELLARGDEVRAVVRSDSAGVDVRDAVERAGQDGGRLEIAVAVLGEDDGWGPALDGVDGVHHVASPMVAADDRAALVGPARDGAVRVLRAARDAGVRRVVLTSSFAAVGYSPEEVRDFDEDDWTDPDTPGLPAYPWSKTVAERASWDFVEREGDGLELVTIAPTWIAGPTLVRRVRSSLAVFVGMLDGSWTSVPRQRFGIADVRDVAAAHIAAMETAAAAGRRYLVLADGPTWTFADVARVLVERTGALGARVRVEEAAGEEMPPLVIRNDRARRELGLRPRDAEATIIETARSLEELGLVADAS